MSPQQRFRKEMETASEEAIRSELWLHRIEPSELVRREILINILYAVYFEG
jgi:hypothetical protein